MLETSYCSLCASDARTALMIQMAQVGTAYLRYAGMKPRPGAMLRNSVLVPSYMLSPSLNAPFMKSHRAHPWFHP